MEKITHRLPRDKSADWTKIIGHHLGVAFKWECDLVFQLKPDQETRSQKQNKLLWLLHGELAKHIHQHNGEVYDGEEIHAFVVSKLLPKRAKVMPDGEPHILRTSTRKLAVKEFAEFLDKYYAWAAQNLNCQLPMPDDLYWDALMKDMPQENSGDGL